MNEFPKGPTEDDQNKRNENIGNEKKEEKNEGLEVPSFMNELTPQQQDRVHIELCNNESVDLWMLDDLDFVDPAEKQTLQDRIASAAREEDLRVRKDAFADIAREMGV